MRSVMDQILYRDIHDAMNNKKASKILQEHNISFGTDRVVRGLPSDINKKNVMRAIRCMARSGGYYNHPHHNSIHSMWDGSKSSALSSNYEPMSNINIGELQKRAHRVYMESIHAQALINSLRHLTIGAGLRLQSTPNAPLLNSTVDKIGDVSTRIEGLWDEWSTNTDVSLSGDQSYQQLEALRALHFYVFGEYFYVRRFSGRNPKLTIEIIDPRKVEQPPGDILETYEGLTKKERAHTIMDGIEIDEQRKKVALYVRCNGKHERVKFHDDKGRRVVAHGYVPHVDEPRVLRGIPPLSRAAHEFEKITDASLLELDSIGVNASIAMTVTADLGANNDIAVLDGIGKKLNTDYSNNDITNDYTNNYSTEHKNIEKGGLMIQKLPPGVKVQPFETRRPNSSFYEFLNKTMEYVAPAVGGFSLELVKMLFGQNFSASRASNDLSWKTFNFYNSIFAKDNAIDLYHVVNVNKSRVGIQSNTSDANMKAWTKSKWHGQIKPVFNPLQEAKASTEMIQSAISTVENESQRYAGVSSEYNFNRRIVEKKKEKAIADIDNDGVENVQ